jgi:hypothetical protein
MQFLAYIVVVLVSFSTILLELHWLTAPAPQPKPTVQVAAAPVPRAKADGPNVELSPVYPKPEAPRSVGSVTGSPPAAAEENAQAAAPAPAAPPQAPVEAAAKVEPKAEPKVEAKVEPAQAPAPQPIATVETKTATKSETSGVATPAEAAQPADSHATVKSTVVQSAPPPQPAPEKTANAAPAAQPVAGKNSCDVQSCARAYSSFNAADCTYQPFQGPRQVCVKPPAQGQKSASVARESNTRESTVREPNADPERKQTKDAELQRAVQFLRGRRAVDEDDFDGPMEGRGREIRRPGWRW